MPQTANKCEIASCKTVWVGSISSIFSEELNDKNTTKTSLLYTSGTKLPGTLCVCTISLYKGEFFAVQTLKRLLQCVGVFCCLFVEPALDLLIYLLLLSLIHI